MKHRNTAGMATLLFLASLSCATAARGESVSIAEYRQQLRDIASELEARQSSPEKVSEVVAHMPDHVSVTTGSGEVTISYKTLKDNLAAIPGGEAQKRPAMLRQAQSYVQDLIAAAETYQKPGADVASSHRKLDEILARREFRKVHGPSALDLLLARFFRWLSRMLGKLRFGAGGSFDWVRLLIYMLIGAAISLLLVWTIRRLRRPQEELSPREIIPFAPSARGWRTWLAEARDLAQQQDWRNAIHLAYWAGISYLEEHGAWKPNRARTPREYLRLIGSRAAQYPVLAALTRKLEVVWYGYGRAAEEDFQETLGQLEKLGCR
jgi:Domain of unknown function (DUF4129)